MFLKKLKVNLIFPMWLNITVLNLIGTANVIVPFIVRKLPHSVSAGKNRCFGDSVAVWAVT